MLCSPVQTDNIPVGHTVRPSTCVYRISTPLSLSSVDNRVRDLELCDAIKTWSEFFEGKESQFMAIVPECRSSTVIRDVQRHKDHDFNGRVTDLQDRRERYT